MSKADDLKRQINQFSLMHTTREDLVKALIKSDTHPELAKVLMYIHDTMHQLDKDVKEIRTSHVQIANTINQMANAIGANSIAVESLAKRSGTDVASLINVEPVNAGDSNAE